MRFVPVRLNLNLSENEFIVKVGCCLLRGPVGVVPGWCLGYTSGGVLQADVDTRPPAAVG